MYFLTQVKNKLKQFNITLDSSKIYQQHVSGKRSDIFDREEKQEYKKDNIIWSNVMEKIKGKKASFYDITPIKYKTEIILDEENKIEKEGEREWYGTEIGYAEFKLISKKTKKEITIRIN